MTRKQIIKKALQSGPKGPRYGGPKNGRPFPKSVEEQAPKIKGKRYL
jgi:hypothetical protein